MYLTSVFAGQLFPMNLGRLTVAEQVLQHDSVFVDFQCRGFLPVTVPAVVVQEPDEEGEIRLAGCNHREGARAATAIGGDCHVDGGDVDSCHILIGFHVLGGGYQQHRQQEKCL